MKNENWKVDLQNFGCVVTPCGSRVTCSPEPFDSDFDFLVVVPNSDEFVARFMQLVTSLGFNWEGSEHYQHAADTFMSWRSNSDVNLIVTRNVEFAKRHHAATEVCRSLNIMDKSYRVKIFQAILYGDYKT